MDDLSPDFLCVSQIKCRSTLRISGLLPSAYWCGQAAVDIPFYYLILSCMTSILFSFHTGNLLTSRNLTAVVSDTHTHAARPPSVPAENSMT